MTRRGTVLLVSLFVSACTTSYEAPLSAQISKAADAPGYIVVGLATQSYQRNLEQSISCIEMSMARRQGGTVVASRNGCGNILGFYGSKPCDLTKLERQVLVVTAGDWLPVNVVEQLHIRRSRRTLESLLPFRSAVHVGPGEIVYLGDFTYESNYDTEEIRLVRHGRDEAAVTQALAAYPGLKGTPVVYRDPTSGG